MKILVVGYTPNWRKIVREAIPAGHSITIKKDSIDAIEAQMHEDFDLYVLGGRLLSEPKAAVYLLEEAKKEDDKTPTIVFSHECDKETESRIAELGATMIRSDEPNANEALTQAIVELLQTA
jgi:DNA-binding response OmpR family regulator